MEGTYAVYFGDSVCGKVQILRQGLYYRIFCRCMLGKDIVCRLRVQFQNTDRNLGVLTPVADGFGLCTKVPAKHFPDIPVRFLLIPVHTITNGTFTPIIPEEPFSYIEKLKEAYLIKKDGQTGSWIP